MAKLKNANRRKQGLPPEFTAEEVLGDNDEYQRYIKEHNKKLRRLQREQNGDNLYEPE